METLINPAKGAFTISTSWTSTAPFKTQTAAFLSAAVASLNPITRSIYVGGAGNLVVVMRDGSTAAHVGVAAGSVIPVRAIALSSGNSATGLLGYY